MVDFQSRDTRRGPVTSDESEDDGDEPEVDAEAEDEDEDESEARVDADAEDEHGEDGSQAPVEEQATDDGATRQEGEPPEQESEAEPAPEKIEAGEPTDAEATAGTTAGASDAGSAAVSERGGGPPTKSTPDSGTDADHSAGQGVEPARAVDVAVVTVGEGSEQAVAAAFESAGHRISTRERLRAEYDGIQGAVDTLVGRDDVDVVVTTGGVGIEPGAVTIEAVHPLLEKALPGFGEAYRSLLYDAIGTGIVAVRTAAGVADGTLVFCLPGDAEAARLAVTEILATEAPEMVAHLAD
jgi:molybdenum cofactor biosynthesis protein B